MIRLTNTPKLTALITGASRGIGAAIAETLAAHGCNLVLTCRDTMAELNALAARLREAHGARVRTVHCDAGDPEAVAALFAGIDRLDILVNNAGTDHIGLLQEMSLAEWDRLVDTNLSACFYTCRLAIPLFLRRDTGAIVNLSSVWGEIGASAEAAYSATKGGVNALTRALAKELAPSRIPVNAIACGFIDTAMNAGFTDAEREAIRAEIPADRFAAPAEVAAAVWQLLAMPDYLTGQIITFDGGWI
ncbi:elongation factor P 5-aminopentanone reductase [Pseudoramibacter faecis]|uniref:elongation factor P 5-aminopentanone reductase n=1 Tax=Pseudoramibacter faecis TaxID=3108534 RepID=UPI002E78729B|nr:SDR family oxidoreductase [Pseudoramibacter sp. HA2172]